MSNTPRTDAAQHEGLLRGNPIPTSVTTAEFARQLERELNAAKANAIDEAVRRMEAAPDLLEALEAIMDSDLWEWNGSAAFWLQDKVKAAIAKAKGES